MTSRILTAFVTAPVLGIATVALLGAQLATHASLEGTIHAFWFLLLFGAPGAYALALLVGGPPYRWMHKTGRLRFSIVALASTILGSLAFAIPWSVIWNQWTLTGVGTAASIGGARGLAAGLWFWLVAFFGAKDTGPA